MNPNREGWPPSQNTGPPSGALGNDQNQQQGGRQAGAFGLSLGTSSQQQPLQQPTAQPVAAGFTPAGPFYTSNQASPHNLPSLPGLTQPQQASPAQASQRPRSAHQEASSAPTNHQTPVQGTNYPLHTLNSSLHSQQHTQAQPNLERDRETHQTRDSELRGNTDDAIMREVDQRDRDIRERERQQHEPQPPREAHTTSIHLHQPVAVPPSARTIHGPNGLLGSGGPMGNPHSATVGAHSGTINLLGGAAQQPHEQQPRMQHPPQQTQQPMIVPFGGPGGPQGPVTVTQGQQPILNDALSYLDQVKVQFVDHPDVYNRFLDIMKDFKSGAIDTPGVIARVSQLFAGNPNLIQGFNTFLPPGYKIECGAGDDPNAIRVTTPQGTTTQSMPAPRSFSPRAAAINGTGNTPSENRQFYDSQQRGVSATWTQQQPAPPVQEPVFSPSSHAMNQPVIGGPPTQVTQPPHSPEMHMRGQHVAAANVSSSHQPESRGISQLPSSTTSVSVAQIPRQSLISPPTSSLQGQVLNGTAHAVQPGAPGGGVERRGPVEFNHAISYVNKIKNRFSQQPDIYKQFLEILQTYQRESKPIQEVYAQVTQLFEAAPDLLEDFKQFLPESAAAQAKAAAQRQSAAEEVAMLSNVRNEPDYRAAQAHHAQHTPRADQPRLPPVGNFAPTPSVGRDNKRKRGERQATVTSSAAMGSSIVPEVGPMVTRPGYGSGTSTNKRAKTQHGGRQTTLPDHSAVSPTLTPALPEPIPPTSASGATSDELAFFDRVKKYIGNKNTMNEFLKLCNLFTYGLIDKSLLVSRAQGFIGGNLELINWFKKFLGYDGKDEIIENRPKLVTSRVSLANCRGYGPSYRLLPVRERMKPCSGRDELCHSVLNDEWASHPTWASEDSGFVAHRKNIHEEGLHRIEEERHDYDFNIEACLRTIQQLDPIAQQLSQTSQDDRQKFELPHCLGGHSDTIYKRVIMKIYGREKGATVIENLFAQPHNVIPVLLLRMKQKLEEWKAAQREWEKVWREQTQKIFWKSLDHQGIGQRQAEKRQFQTKTIQNETQAKYEEQRRQREIHGLPTPKWQFSYAFDDVDVLYDVARLILAHSEAYHNVEHHRISKFIKEFVPLFFGLDTTSFDRRLQGSAKSSPRPEDMETDDMPSPDDGYSPRGRANGKKNEDLRRGVLDRSRTGKPYRKEKEDSVASGSGVSSPENASAVDEDMSGDVESSSGLPLQTSTSEKWISHSNTECNSKDTTFTSPNQPFSRDSFHMYCNLQLYCFFRMFVTFYERLCHLKQSEEKVHETVKRAKANKPALELGIIDKVPQDFFGDTSNRAVYYVQVLTMMEDCIKGGPGGIDSTQIEETLRRYYLQCGWELYSFDKLLNSINKAAISILSNDGKDKSHEIWQLFKKDRSRQETTHQDELNYRKQVEKYVKDGEIYRITFDVNEMKAHFQIFKKDDATFDNDALSPEKRWSYYIASWTNIDPTEGIRSDLVKIPFLKHFGIRPEDSSDEFKLLDKVESDGGLEIKISSDNYRMVFVDSLHEWTIHPRSTGDQGDTAHVTDRRARTAEEKLMLNNPWMKDLSKDDVDAKKQAFERCVKELNSQLVDVNGDPGDVEMAEA